MILSNFATGTDASFIWEITALPSTLITSTFTIKLVETDTTALILKTINTVNTIGVGQIEDDGSSGKGRIRFDLVPFDTKKLLANVKHRYWVDIVLSSGKQVNIETGTIFAIQGSLLT